MDDRTVWSGAARGVVLVALVALSASGCAPYIGTTAKSFMKHVRTNPDPNVRYLAYTKLGSKDLFDDPQDRVAAVAVLIDRYKKGKEPLASRAMICRTLGELGDPAAREVLLKAVNHPEAVVKIEACRALGKVGKSEDASVLARIMTLDPLEDARVAAIDGLADLKSDDPRITKVLLDAMEHDDPAIRLASLDALRKITGKDLGTEVGPWRKDLEPLLAAAELAAPSDARSPADEAASKSAAARGPFASLPEPAEADAAEPGEPPAKAVATAGGKSAGTAAAEADEDEAATKPIKTAAAGKSKRRPAKAEAGEDDEEEDATPPFISFFLRRGKALSDRERERARARAASEWADTDARLKSNGITSPNR